MQKATIYKQQRQQLTAALNQAENENKQKLTEEKKENLQKGKS